MPSRRPPSGTPGMFAPPRGLQPLAARMRPLTLDEFVGQEHLVGEHGPLRRSVARGHLGSILLWGPPGSGKTTLGRLLADAVGARFTTLSAVMRGLAGALGPDGGVALADDAFEHLVDLAGGDARAALNVLEGAVALADAEDVRDKAGHVAPRLADVEAAAQQRILAYDRAGDGHYD